MEQATRNTEEERRTGEDATGRRLRLSVLVAELARPWRLATALQGGGGQAILSAMFHVGLGYDSHRFDPKRPLVLGGVRIDGAPGLAGHSDADAVLHAVTDAILGAAGLGDIGEQFPDTDPAYAGADSRVLLAKARDLAAGRGWRCVNCDVTVLAERPRLSGVKPAMAAAIAGLLGLGADAVSVKAKTNEGMGAIGRGEGIAVLAVVLMESAVG
jgi:2-C-methyl-D-erythritol 2,4-cyclodiphosphate synthase